MNVTDLFGNRAFRELFGTAPAPFKNAEAWHAHVMRQMAEAIAQWDELNIRAHNCRWDHPRDYSVTYPKEQAAVLVGMLMATADRIEGIE